MKSSREESRVRRFIKSDVSGTYSVSIIRVCFLNVVFYKSPHAAVCQRKIY